MKKVILAFFILALLPAVVSAINIEVEKKEISPVVIAEVSDPATFSFTITNNGDGDFFEIYTLIGVSMTPKGTFYLNSGEKKTLEVGAYPSKDIKDTYKGPFVFEYQIRSSNSGIFKDQLKIKIVELEDLLEIEPVKLSDKNNIEIRIINKENIEIESMTLSFDSEFFDSEHELSFEPNEKKTITLQANKDVKGIVAGKYPLNTDIEYKRAKANMEAEIDYLENGGISVNRESSGFIIKTTKVTKYNEGNVNLEAEIVESRDVLTRLFTTYSEKPTTTSRKGLLVEYSWERELSPGESLEVEYTTNYTFPFILLILIVGAILAVKLYTQTNLVLNKRVSMIKTKGGELALKITLRIKAKKHLDNIEIIDRLPGMTKIYEKFGTRPDKIEEKTRRLFWNLRALNAGEERVFSYIIYSKINVVGSFELPEALAIYEHEGKTFRTSSNKTYFVSETFSGD